MRMFQNDMYTLMCLPSDICVCYGGHTSLTHSTHRYKSHFKLSTLYQ